MDTILKYKKYIIGVGVFLVLVILSIFLIPKEEVKQEVIPIEKEIVKEEKVIIPDKIFVDVKGEVKTPGVYELDNNSRIIDAIKKAGGLTKNANTTANNLSKKVVDEMVIVVYSKKEISEFVESKEALKQIVSECNKEEYDVTNNSCITNTDINNKNDNSNNNTLININIATKNDLLKISGIGEAKALAIIDYRDEHGGFKTIEDIMEVSGIGESIFAQIKNFITTE